MRGQAGAAGTTPQMGLGASLVPRHPCARYLIPSVGPDEACLSVSAGVSGWGCRHHPQPVLWLDGLLTARAGSPGPWGQPGQARSPGTMLAHTPGGLSTSSRPMPVCQAIPGGLRCPDLPPEPAAFDKCLQRRSDSPFQGKGLWGEPRHLTAVLETLVRVPLLPPTPLSPWGC